MRKLIDLTGKRFGRLVVIGIGKPICPKQIAWICRCDCGKETTVQGNSLRGNVSRSCGCLRAEQLTGRNTKHGQATRANKSPEYHIWGQMLARCTRDTHKQWADYGGRGIRVCEEWSRSFSAFLRDMGPRPSNLHSIDRHPNNDGNYEPGNCRWATRGQQLRNTRRNCWIEYAGLKLTVVDWASALGICYGTLITRFHKGRVPERLLSTSVEDAIRMTKRFR